MTMGSLVRLSHGSFCPAALPVEAMLAAQQGVVEPVRWWVPMAVVVPWLQ